MAKADKAADVAEIADAFRDSSAAVLTDYRGLTVAQITQLRRAMGASTRYTVVKNTLTRIAAREAGVTGIDELLVGPTAVAFVTGDPVEAAKSLRDFARTNPALVVKGGVLDGAPLSTDEIRRLADLESREVLLSRMAGAMSGSLSKAVGLFAAPLSQLARLAEALRQKAEADPSVLGGGSGTPAPIDAATAPAADDSSDTAAAPETTDTVAAPAATDTAAAPAATDTAAAPEATDTAAAPAATDTAAAPEATDTAVAPHTSDTALEAPAPAGADDQIS